jgi:hypothetical protein
MKRFTCRIFCLAVVLSGLRADAQAQTNRFYVGVEAGAALPTTNFAQIAGPGFSGGVLLGWGLTDRLAIVLQATHHNFGDGENDQGEPIEGSLTPVELGVQYYIDPGGRSFYLTYTGGIYFKGGDFAYDRGGMMVGAGYSIPVGTAGTRLQLGANYHSRIDDDFESFLVLDVGVVFQL